MHSNGHSDLQALGVRRSGHATLHKCCFSYQYGIMHRRTRLRVDALPQHSLGSSRRQDILAWVRRCAPIRTEQSKQSMRTHAMGIFAKSTLSSSVPYCAMYTF